MKELKAIPTIYNGVKFRSRLEARWALFFDLCKIEWEYEKEGYQLTTGWYVPDFWIPSMKIWVEVKPPGIRCPHAMALHDETTFPVLVTCGLPDQGGTVYLTDSGDSSGGFSEQDVYAWGTHKDSIVLAINDVQPMGLFNSDWTPCKSVVTRDMIDTSENSLFRFAICNAKRHSFWG